MSEIEDEQFLYKLPTNPNPRPTHAKTDAEIKAMYTDERQILRIQVSKKRRDFGSELNLHDKDNDQPVNIPSLQEMSLSKGERKRINNISLDAYLPRTDVFTQTILPKTVTIGIETLPLEVTLKLPEIVVESESKKNTAQRHEREKLLLFLKKVQGDMEKALTVNETIDVFSNDFILVTDDDDQQKDTGATELSIIKVLKSFEYPECKKKMISCIKFQPNFTGQQHQFLATSFIENLTFEERLEISARSFKNQILLWNYKDMHLFTPLILLVSNLEIVVFEFKPSDPNIIIGSLGSSSWCD